MFSTPLTPGFFLTLLLQSELFNGRAAMIGFLAMIILEQVSGKALL